jgi:hypothetical protein
MRLEAPARLSDEDREMIVEIARAALARFISQPESTPAQNREKS